MIKRLAAFLVSFFFITQMTLSQGADPEPGTIGGTGKQPKPALPDGIFNQPELPERIDIPDVIDTIPENIPDNVPNSIDAADLPETPAQNTSP